MLPKMRINMKISKIEEAERIVSAIPNMYWDGWDIVYKHESADGFLDNNGVFIDNKWHVKKSFKAEKDGWNIPDKYLKGYSV